MVQADINPKVDLMILRIPPSRIDDLVRVCRGVNGTIGDSVIHAIVTVVGDPIRQAVRPIDALARVTYACLRRRNAGGRRRRAKLERLIAGKCQHTVIVGVVWRGVIEDRLLGGRAGIRRIQKRRDRLQGRDGPFRGGAARSQKDATENDRNQRVLLNETDHDLLK